MRVEYRRPTEAQLAVLQLVAGGLSTAQAAEELGCSKETTRTHMSNVMARLHVHSSTRAVVIALCEGWIECPNR